MRFHKYHALGNDYLVLENLDGRQLDRRLVRRLCDRHLGVGSDGLLVETSAPGGDGFALRILNPDGSEAEKSGNGLRIFARYLHDAGRVGDGEFPVTTLGGTVRCRVLDGGRSVYVEMGRATFHSDKIPVAGPARDVVDEAIVIDGEELRFTAVTVGNPHCVVHTGDVSAERARSLGPTLETHALFPNRTNVQFVDILGPHRIRIEIWERGAGYTLASGSSSCAAAAACVRLGRCSGAVTVMMPGGSLDIAVSDELDLTMTGPAAKVADGTIATELLNTAAGVEE